MVAHSNNRPSRRALAALALDRRRMLALGGLAAGAGALGACGSNTGRGSSDGVNLYQWYHQYGEAGTKEAAEKYAAAYEDATVSINWVPGDYDTTLSSGLLAENPGDYPDVFESHLNRSMVDSGQIVPLDDLFDGVLDDFTDIDVKRNSIDGKIYGIQMIDDPQFLYYRPSLLADAGVAEPATFDDLAAAAAELTTSDVKGLFLGNDDSATKLFQPIVFSAGQTLLTDDFQIGFDKDTVIAGALQVKALHESGSLLIGAPTEAWDPSSIIQGLCAIQWCGLWALPQIIDTYGDDIAVMPFPGFAGGAQTVYNGGWSTFVNAKSEHVDEAKAFAKWLWIDNEEYIQDWCLSYGFHIPPRKSMAANADALAEGPAATAVQISQDYGWGDDPNWTPTMETAVDDMMTHIVLEGADPSAEFDTAAQTIQTELDSIFG
ncbi:multiple sugar transport system substrate-binding protein [Glycomyces sambucus]|uniref:Multiple sugar transport system substrate-binding protein n=1 Tax=Glycomyces sambucus TaxID=380244 RepID=A0A1G9EWA3_9ACTN|nr:extracellular solute-binding protein [Glycomyces sambucus]SDK80390.1 multiple sugar transport system substrate-binding protein [Glycomyces sambucus]